MDIKELEDKIKKLESKKNNLYRKKNEIHNSIADVESTLIDLYEQRDSVDINKKIQVYEAMKDHVYIFRGAVGQNDPRRYMMESINKFIKEKKIEYYNLFIEDTLDNPFVWILIVDINNFDYDFLKLKKERI